MAIPEQNYVATSGYAGYYTDRQGERTYTVLLGRDTHYINQSDRQELIQFEAERLAWNSTVAKIGKILFFGAYGTSLLLAPVPTLIGGAVLSPITCKFLDDSMFNELIAKEMSVYLMNNPRDEQVQAFLFAKHKIRMHA
ncbi:MAG: hypothetical protein JSR46_02040 [Verrucomicrobia bacterium]|nr:hypothetical protein [Verrucomicrobiota bacterium]